MPQGVQKAGASSKKYSSLVSSGLRKPLAIGMRPNDMKGAILVPQTRQCPFIVRRLTVSCLEALCFLNKLDGLVPTTRSGHNLVPAPPASMIPFQQLLIACSQAPQSL